MIVFAKIKDEENEWVEEFKEGTTEEQIKVMISEFNSDLRRHETPRTFIGMEEQPKDFVDEELDLSYYIIGKKLVDDFAPLKSRADKGRVAMWVKKEWINKIKKEKRIKKVLKSELEANMFACPSPGRPYIPTEWCYTHTDCMKCLMIFRATNGGIFFCRLNEHTDGRKYR